MTLVRGFAAVATLTMLAVIVWGLVTGDFTGEGAELLGLVWGRVTLVDLYLAFTAVWAWIAWREGSVGRAVLWAVLVAVLGSLAIWGYVWWAARGATDVQELLVGPHRSVTS
ncbi:DUF1475 family protein [Salsipaludibacter albus]|uniref:DUF1475 family protein n=1 Tax=Salsipaludibacter albus TaxID=2849650 RepID=UPI001EE3E432|nr:DUF1475 family protein [Salsipaludibacter albus]MBY5164401.1 DUF1475 domain-containing protein [Salsipaludibacter albus]